MALRASPFRRNPHWFRPQIETLEDRTLLSTIYAIARGTPDFGRGGVLIRFDSASPGQVTTIGPVTGLDNGLIFGIDFRPRTGHLYADLERGFNQVFSTFIINPHNAQSTKVGDGVFILSGAPLGYSFDPIADLIRYVNVEDENARIDPNTGHVAFNDTDLAPAPTSTIIAAAYDRSFQRSLSSTDNPTLYVIDRHDSQLAIVGGLNGTPSPNTGLITDLAPLGFTLNQTSDGGFDIAGGAGQEVAYAALVDAADNLTRLYRINLVRSLSTTPVATPIGLIGNGLLQIHSIAVAPEGDLQVVGSDQGVAARVKVVDPTTHFLIADFGVFGPDFRGGARVATGDVNGDGTNDVIVAAGPGTQPRILVVDGTKLKLTRPDEQIAPAALLGSFLAYSPNFRGGLHVAAGDVNGDGRSDIIVRPGSGAQRVKVFNGTKLTPAGGLLSSFFAYPPTFKGGVTVAAGDVNGDGRADVITGMAKGGSRVKVVDGAKVNQVSGSGAISGAALLGSFLAFAPGYTRGVHVGAGDVSADFRFDILVGAGGGAPTVRVVDANRLNEKDANGRIAGSALLRNFQAFSPGYTGGVRVAATKANVDGQDDLLVASAHPNRSRVRLLDGATQAELDAFFAFVGGTGAFVSGS